MSLNKVQIIGHLGQAPEIRSSKDGKEIATFSIASSQNWKDKQTGERKTKSEWHRVVVFSPALINITKNYLKKGSKIYLEGSLQTRKWTDNNGVERYTTEIVMSGFDSKLIILDNNKKNNQQEKIYMLKEDSENDSTEMNDEIHF